MDAITTPKKTYKGPPPGRLPASCPQCGCVLEHFLAKTARPAAPSPAEAAQAAPPRRPGPSVPFVDLFAAPVEGPQEAVQELTDSTKPAPLPEGAETGDILLPEPEFARITELQLGKAKQKSAKKGKSTPPESKKVTPAANRTALQVLDDPKIGGKVTVCVLLFGDHHALHRRCLTSIVETVPPSRMDLRVATNQICLDTRNYLNTLPIQHISDDTKTRRKYPAMRQLFHDKKHPIETKWVLWFDDDSHARRDDWLIQLGNTIKELQPADNVAMLGVKMLHVLKHPKNKDPRRWFQNADWFQNQHFLTKQGRAAPNGNTIHFVVGGFWALRTDAIYACDIPDTRLNHNGGDICIGCQLQQAGYNMWLFNKDKKYVYTSHAPRRGYQETPPWLR
jgi:hypothetical protein